MKRELDLIRAILLQLEQDIDWNGKLYAFGLGDDQKLVVEGYTDDRLLLGRSNLDCHQPT
jgi:hypothetical protein